MTVKAAETGPRNEVSLFPFPSFFLLPGVSLNSLQSFPPFAPALGLFSVIKAPLLFSPKSFYSAAGWLTFSNGDNINILNPKF